jgi:uncharacterized lipoprotein YbaY/heat shock protein HslJ
MDMQVSLRHHSVLITLALSTTVAIAAQNTKIVTGAATYRERVALPPDAVFEAVLEQGSGVDAPAVVIGRTLLEKPGQPPFRFSIAYDPARITEARSYSVRARVTAGGKLLFITDQYPVLTKGHKNQPAMMILRRAGVPASGAAGPAVKQAEAPVVRRGMFRYMADAANFTDCKSGQRWPVAMEGAYKRLEAAYLATRRQPGEALLVEVEAELATRPNTEEGRAPVLTLVIARYVSSFPGETCGARQTTSPLRETNWKLTHLRDKPVMPAEKQGEPSLVFRSQEGRVTGFSGCNNLTGTYEVKGNEITISGVVATRKACLHGMDIEEALFEVIEKARTWKISGEHLELYDTGGTLLARFEARPLK